MESELKQNLVRIQERIAAALLRSGRATQVQLVAVSKLQPASLVQEFLNLGGSIVLGENYVQEFKKKRVELKGDFKAHLIGPLQRNKAKLAVELFDLIESVHSAEIAEALNKAAAQIGKIQEVFLQVNISGDAAKSGFSAEATRTFFRDQLASLNNLKCTGLMTITELYEKAEDARADFRALYQLSESLRPGLLLSMGMSQDFEIAVEEGATHVRVGTALFGERSTKP